MTKKELELENQFLKLQLKIIGILASECCGADREKIFENIGSIIYHSTNYQNSLNFIKENSLPYNFYDENITI